MILQAPMKRALQRVVQQSLRQRILDISNHLLLAGCSVERRMYDTMRKDYYSSFTAQGVYHIMSNCHCCARIGLFSKNKRHLQLLSVT